MSIDDGMQWRTRFTNIVLVNNKMYPNDTEIKVTFQPKTNDAQTQNLTFEKYKYFLVKVLQNSMFIQKNEKHYNFFKQFNINNRKFWLTLPVVSFVIHIQFKIIRIVV